MYTSVVRVYSRTAAQPFHHQAPKLISNVGQKPPIISELTKIVFTIKTAREDAHYIRADNTRELLLRDETKIARNHPKFVW